MFTEIDILTVFDIMVNGWILLYIVYITLFLGCFIVFRKVNGEVFTVRRVIFGLVGELYYLNLWLF